MSYSSKLLNQMMSTTSTVSSSTSQSTNNNSDISLMMVNPDEEPVIQIEADLRTIIIPDVLKNIAVTGDHLSETIYFSCPRYFDGEDLSKHTCIVRFINAGNEYGEDETVDMTVEDDSLKFGWSLDNRVTRYRGTIQFTIQFETGNVDYQWQTTPAELNILPGIDVEETITDKDDTLFRSLTRQISDLQDRVSRLEGNVLDLQALLEDIEKLKADVKYLKENVVYTISEMP